MTRETILALLVSAGCAASACGRDARGSVVVVATKPIRIDVEGRDASCAESLREHHARCASKLESSRWTITDARDGDSRHGFAWAAGAPEHDCNGCDRFADAATMTKWLASYGWTPSRNGDQEVYKRKLVAYAQYVDGRLEYFAHASREADDCGWDESKWKGESIMRHKRDHLFGPNTYTQHADWDPAHTLYFEKTNADANHHLAACEAAEPSCSAGSCLTLEVRSSTARVTSSSTAPTLDCARDAKRCVGHAGPGFVWLTAVGSTNAVWRGVPYCIDERGNLHLDLGGGIAALTCGFHLTRSLAGSNRVSVSSER